MTAASVEAVLRNVGEISRAFEEQRQERQHRTRLDPADFERLREAGLPLVGALAEHHGLWVSVEESTRPVCEMLRALARGDSSVALVAAMHPTVMWDFGWLSDARPPPEHLEAWERQRAEVFATIVRDGAFWGTIWSEPGDGADLAHPRAVTAVGPGGGHRITGLKHLGSGLGVTSYMGTVAVPAGETEADTFFVDLRGVPWDGSRGMELVAAWDGHGMAATQSHMVRFEGFPATRSAWPRGWAAALQLRASPIGCFWAAVVLGIVEVAVETARATLERRRSEMRAFDRVEWSRVGLEAWLVEQAYEGMLRAVAGTGPAHSALIHGKVAIAELAESALTRLCRVIGGSSYSRRSPFGWWHQDVRVLGFLRPRWGLAYEALFELGGDGGGRAGP